MWNALSIGLVGPLLVENDRLREAGLQRAALTGAVGDVVAIDSAGGWAAVAGVTQP